MPVPIPATMRAAGTAVRHATSELGHPARQDGAADPERAPPSSAVALRAEIHDVPQKLAGGRGAEDAARAAAGGVHHLLDPGELPVDLGGDALDRDRELPRLRFGAQGELERHGRHLGAQRARPARAPRTRHSTPR